MDSLSEPVQANPTEPSPEPETLLSASLAPSMITIPMILPDDHSAVSSHDPTPSEEQPFASVQH